MKKGMRLHTPFYAYQASDGWMKTNINLLKINRRYYCI